MNLSIGDDGDIQNATVEGPEEIRQHLGQRLQTFLNEWFLDLSIGLPYFEEILIKQPNQAGIESIFIDEILNCPGVIRLLDFSLDLDKATRSLEVIGTVESIDGLVDFSVGVG